MRYTTWLWFQVEELGSEAGFAKVCYDDINNGCASSKFSAKDWMRHFDEKHPDKRDILIPQLIKSINDYQKSVLQ